MKYTPSKQVKDAINNNKPILALESTIIASGMPYPQNKEFYNKAAEICYGLNVVPAAIAIIKGVVHVGLDQSQVEHIATDGSVNKISQSRKAVSSYAQGGIAKGCGGIMKNRRKVTKVA